MQAEMTVEVDRCGIAPAGPWNRDIRPLFVILRVTVRPHHIEAIDCAAHEDDDQPLAITAIAECARCPSVRSHEDHAGRRERRRRAQKVAPCHHVRSCQLTSICRSFHWNYTPIRG